MECADSNAFQGEVRGEHRKRRGQNFREETLHHNRNRARNRNRKIDPITITIKITKNPLEGLTQEKCVFVA